MMVSENQAHATVALEHDHGLQEITIQGTTALPEFPLPAALAAIGFATHLYCSGGGWRKPSGECTRQTACSLLCAL
jgi:hypothetical protein